MKDHHDKIFIVGGLGFIGSALLLVLADHYPLVCLDPADKRLLLPARSWPVEFITGNLTDGGPWEAALQQCSIIMNFAGGGGNKRALQDPYRAFQSYVSGHKRLLVQAAKCGIKHIYLASTVAVYPQQNEILTETTEPQPGDYYSALKLVAEYLLIESGLPGTIMRLTNIYGYTPSYPVQAGGALGNFIKAVASGNDLVVHGDGSEQIEYLHICDLIAAVMLLLKSSAERKGTEIFNLGSGETIAIRELAALVLAESCKQAERGGRIRFDKDCVVPGVAGNRMVSFDKIRKRLNWVPQVSLRQGITEMLEKCPRAHEVIS